MIIRGDDFVVQASEANDKVERVGFYVVRTALAVDDFTAGRLALFDFETELRTGQKFGGSFLSIGSLAVEEVRPLDENEEDVASGFILYPMV